MGKKLILFNGAPNSGKDASAEIMKEVHGFGGIFAFKDELYKATAKYFGLDLDDFVKMARDRILKDKKSRLILKRKGLNFFQRLWLLTMSIFTNMGISPREALIHVSEDIIKPKHGDDFFGRKLSKSVKDSKHQIAYVSDSGFISEIKPLLEDGHDVYVVRLHRDGCTFANDSRSMLTDEQLTELGVKFYDVDNNGTLEDLKKALIDVACKIALGR